MPRVCLREPLKRLAGDRAEHELARRDGRARRCEALESAHPALDGWILDERGVMRRHINVFVNGERGGAGHDGRGRGPDRRPPGDLRRLHDDRAAGGDEEGPVRARGRAGRAATR